MDDIYIEYEMIRPGVHRQLINIGKNKKNDDLAQTISPKPDDPGPEEANTTAALGKAVIGKMKLGRT